MVLSCLAANDTLTEEIMGSKKYQQILKAIVKKEKMERGWRLHQGCDLASNNGHPEEVQAEMF